MADFEPGLYNPLCVDTDSIIKRGNLAAVVARAGIGKTSFLVQIALSCMMHRKKVLHVSLHDSVKKISLWYKEIFNNLAVQLSLERHDTSLDALLPYRFIMTFQVDGFKLLNFKERFSDITEQKIFVPDVLIIDGFPLDATAGDSLKEIKAFAEQNSLSVWFAGRIHRDEAPDIDGTPAPFFHVADNFDVAMQLQPRDKKIYVDFLKGLSQKDIAPELHIDPATMLIQKI
jgi:hypothetical protein